MLSTTGGDNINQITYRVMATLMTDELMNKYSFAGKKGKMCFRDTIFLHVVCGNFLRFKAYLLLLMIRNDSQNIMFSIQMLFEDSQRVQ